MSRHRFFSTPSMRRTVFDEKDETTPIEDKIVDETRRKYRYTHQLIKNANESAIVDSIPVGFCPHCQSGEFIRWGRTKQGFTRYLCSGCGKTFNALTGTPFERHRLGIGRWVEFVADLCDFMSLAEISKSMRISETTAKYWLVEIFVTLRDWQQNMRFSKCVIDEYFLRKASTDITIDGKGRKRRGLSRDQLCICTAVDKRGNVTAEYVGEGMPSEEMIMNGYSSHLIEGGMIIHDGEPAHDILRRRLHLKEKKVDSKKAKLMDDRKNPLTPINNVHSRLSSFWIAHMGFSRRDLQDWLNLFCFIVSSPHNSFKKANILLRDMVNFSKNIRYRDVFGASKKIIP